MYFTGEIKIKKSIRYDITISIMEELYGKQTKEEYEKLQKDLFMAGYGKIVDVFNSKIGIINDLWDKHYNEDAMIDNRINPNYINLIRAFVMPEFKKVEDELKQLPDLPAYPIRYGIGDEGNIVGHLSGIDDKDFEMYIELKEL